MMRIAYLIMCHKNPFQLERLVKRLSHPNFDIYIHLDKKTDDKTFEYLQSFRRVHFIKNRVRCNWGGFSFVKAITGSMNEIIQSNVKYDFINLLSAQDYLLKSQEDIYNFYKANVGKSFISFDDTDCKYWWTHAVKRYQLYHLTDFRFRGKYFLQKVINLCMPTRKFPLDIRLYGGSCASWWSLSWESANYIVSYIADNSKLIKFMKYTWGADEFLFPSILMNSSLSDNIINDNLRFIIWEEKKVNPKLLTTDDLWNMLDSGKLYARKFDMTIDSDVLDELDAQARTLNHLNRK